ncbi:MAG: class I SAM-dependent methyltransferase [Taibaiella sp.]|nr:class I SAM-dependent methyltransferase [Taibaiella sp.]
MKQAKDNFSAQANEYAQFRPGYPQEMFEWLFSYCSGYKAAWDCATGNGQAAVNIAEKFEIIYATDLSISQLEKSLNKENIIYLQGKAEEPDFENDSFDLVTVAQALHWLDHDRFFTEVKRVEKNRALFAAWGYGLLTTYPEIDELIHTFYKDIIGPYWDKERQHIDNHYSDIRFPFEELPCPVFAMHYNWTVEHMMGYLNSWSAVQHYINTNGSNPVDIIKDDLIKTWGDGERPVTFPIFMRAGIITK